MKLFTSRCSHLKITVTYILLGWSISQTGLAIPSHDFSTGLQQNQEGSDAEFIFDDETPLYIQIKEAIESGEVELVQRQLREIEKIESKVRPSDLDLLKSVKNQANLFLIQTRKPQLNAESKTSNGTGIIESEGKVKAAFAELFPKAQSIFNSNTNSVSQPKPNQTVSQKVRESIQRMENLGDKFKKETDSLKKLILTYAKRGELQYLAELRPQIVKEYNESKNKPSAHLQLAALKEKVDSYYHEFTHSEEVPQFLLSKREDISYLLALDDNLMRLLKAPKVDSGRKAQAISYRRALLQTFQQQYEFFKKTGQIDRPPFSEFKDKLQHKSDEASRISQNLRRINDVVDHAHQAKEQFKKKQNVVEDSVNLGEALSKIKSQRQEIINHLGSKNGMGPNLAHSYLESLNRLDEEEASIRKLLGEEQAGLAQNSRPSDKESQSSPSNDLKKPSETSKENGAVSNSADNQNRKMLDRVAGLSQENGTHSATPTKGKKDEASGDFEEGKSLHSVADNLSTERKTSDPIRTGNKLASALIKSPEESTTASGLGGELLEKKVAQRPSGGGETSGPPSSWSALFDSVAKSFKSIVDPLTNEQNQTSASLPTQALGEDGSKNREKTEEELQDNLGYSLRKKIKNSSSSDESGSRPRLQDGGPAFVTYNQFISTADESLDRSREKTKQSYSPNSDGTFSPVGDSLSPSRQPAAIRNPPMGNQSWESGAEGEKSKLSVADLNVSEEEASKPIEVDSESFWAKVGIQPALDSLSQLLQELYSDNTDIKKTDISELIKSRPGALGASKKVPFDPKTAAKAQEVKSRLLAQVAQSDLNSQDSLWAKLLVWLGFKS